jgi:hypothetical protein
MTSKTLTVAYCWASGLIEFSAPDAVPSGAIEIARGEDTALRREMCAVARHGYGKSVGKLLVPGIPEAASQSEAGDALARFLDWCDSRRAKGISYNQNFV